ncbi:MULTISPECIES: NAD(P)-dependent oxidoreductase [unclassified Clostridium]|uniref:NAD(P)-dependent oxidoreductase n=1 Tax=unclassified Clostridium TaxID=2614128 RepID=UPI00189B76BC|nr:MULTISPECIES: NAD(P)-dependent oxidoreductase [unclassified Clostridium]MCR1950292.1 NAD(P)-dependent oxidoreductase [Clostridium sp. DSM 100503]
MYKDTRKDIPKESLNYTYISIMSKKLRVGIVGGGNVGYIKGKNFLHKGCIVDVLSLNFIDKFSNLKDINLIKGEYNKDFIRDKHLIIIATDDYNKNLEIKKDCDDEYKIYIFASEYSNGMAVAPVQRELKNISFSVNTKNGNPKGSLMIAEKILDLLKNYDDFIGYSSLIREQAKSLRENKNDIIKFICSEDFKYIYEKGKDKIVIDMFFGKEVSNKIYKNL